MEKLEEDDARNGYDCLELTGINKNGKEENRYLCFWDE